MKLEPFTLVLVHYPSQCVEHHDYYTYIGELVSRPVPGTPQTIMVRRVPGHPGTMEEMPVDRLFPLTSKGFHWVHYAAVAPIPGWLSRSQFPVDMLRYDSAAPVNFRIIEDERCNVKTEIISPE